MNWIKYYAQRQAMEDRKQDYHLCIRKDINETHERLVRYAKCRACKGHDSHCREYLSRKDYNRGRA